MQMLYIHRFSIFDNKDANEDLSSQQSYNKFYFIMSAIFFSIIGVSYLLLYYRIRLLLNYFNQKETLKTRLHKKETELKLMTPIQTVEDVVKRMEKNKEKTRKNQNPY
uniref:Uncharacterized protein n=1 Tax=Meloidogyne enterolobii TaxID=390850 RepID=A0A6V7YD96_MELEN|nr:unnamed protein product [Meloidogyne enterolobii]